MDYGRLGTGGRSGKDFHGRHVNYVRPGTEGHSGRDCHGRCDPSVGHADSNGRARRPDAVQRLPLSCVGYCRVGSGDCSGWSCRGRCDPSAGHDDPSGRAGSTAARASPMGRAGHFDAAQWLLFSFQ